MGSFGGLLSRWPSGASGKGNNAGLEIELAEGEAGSSRSVSITRSSAPVDFAADRAEYADEPVEADRLRIGRRGETGDDSEYCDSELATDGKRILFLPVGVFLSSGLTVPVTEDGWGVAVLALVASSSSASESAYASPPYSDSERGDDGSCVSFTNSGSGLLVSTSGNLFLNFSKKGSLMDAADGVVGVAGNAGNDVLGGSGAGGTTRSRCRVEPIGLTGDAITGADDGLIGVLG